MKRIVLKLSGEALAVKDEKGKVLEIYDPAFVERVASSIKACADSGYELCVVVGAGNIWRGRAGGDMDRTEADRMGMLATVMNAICLKDALVRAGASAVVMTSVPMYPFAEVYSSQAARRALDGGSIVVFGGDDSPLDILLRVKSEELHGHTRRQAKRCGGRIDRLQILRKNLRRLYLLNRLGIRILLRIGIVYVINALRHKNGVGTDLCRPDGNGGIGRQEGNSESAAKYDDAAAVKSPAGSLCIWSGQPP